MPLLEPRLRKGGMLTTWEQQVGKHNEKRTSYGHSMIIDPWGVVLADLGQADGEPSVAVADIDHDLLKKVRSEMPLARRTYGAQTPHGIGHLLTR